MKADMVFVMAAAALAALAVVYVVKRRQASKPTPVEYNGNVYPDRETALMFKDQERLFQAY